MAAELRLSKELNLILHHSKSRTFTFGDLLHRLGVQGQIVFLMVLVAPMLQPVPLPGISSILSLMVVITAFEILFNLPPRLPKRFHLREIDSRKLEKWLVSSLKLLLRIETYCRPRNRWYGEVKIVRKVATVLVMLTALLLALPLPIPFSNFFPSTSIFAFGMGLLEDDGLFYVFGFLLFLVSAFYIGMIFVVPWYLTH